MVGVGAERLLLTKACGHGAVGLDGRAPGNGALLGRQAVRGQGVASPGEQHCREKHCWDSRLLEGEDPEDGKGAELKKKKIGASPNHKPS